MIRSGSSVPSLPNHFPDELVLEHIRDLAAPYLAAQNVNEAANDCNADMNIQQQLQSHHNTKVSTNLGYELTCGLVMKLKNAVDRLSRRSRIRIIENVISLQLLLLLLCKRFAIDPDSTLFKHWNDTSLYDAAHELICKSIAISADLQKLLIEQPFIQSSVTGTYIKFDKQFLQQVQLYFNEVSRPEGTFEEDSMLSDELITKLAELPRELCTECNGRRHVYCGDCCGKRLQSSSCILPSRVDLPFNILLVVHWHETLHKCTGVHAGVLATEGSVSHVQWVKDDTYDDIAAIISSQDKDQITLSNTTHNTIDQTIENTNTNTTTSNLAQDALCHVSTATNTTTVSTEVGSEDVNEFRRKFRRVNVAEHQSVIVDDMGPIWGDIALGLSADSDVLLFPSDDAVDAEDFDWFCRSTIQLLDQSSSSMNNRTTIETATRISSNIQSNSVSSHSSNNLTNSDATTSSSLNTNKKWRLVVLEASWMHAKGVYRKINLYREKYKLPPIPCVRLNDITGQYWKFHEQGHAAVSSIEAIAYAAKAAGSTDETFHKLLTLFRLQKYRVLKRIRDGGKPPKAIKISGTGPGSWDSVLARALDE